MVIIFLDCMYYLIYTEVLFLSENLCRNQALFNNYISKKEDEKNLYHYRDFRFI